MRCQPIDKQDEFFLYMAAEFFQMTDELHIVNRCFEEPEVEFRTMASGRAGQGSYERSRLPTTGRSDDGCDAFRRPGSPDRWPLGDAAFIKKSDARAPFQPLFWIRGHVVLRQPLMASSSRSFALVSGF